jgi:hypothetical protein
MKVPDTQCLGKAEDNNDDQIPRHLTLPWSPGGVQRRTTAPQCLERHRFANGARCVWRRRNVTRPRVVFSAILFSLPLPFGGSKASFQSPPGLEQRALWRWWRHGAAM